MEGDDIMWTFADKIIISDIYPRDFSSFDSLADDEYKFAPTNDEMCIFLDRVNEVSTDKGCLLKYIDEQINVLKDMQTKSITAAIYYHNYISMLQTFREKVEKYRFITNLDNGWYYIVNVSRDGARLLLGIAGCEYDYYNKHIRVYFYNQMLAVEIFPKMMSVDDFAKQYEVGSGTVRQWIRRGKLLDVEKVGTTWKISNLALIEKNYKPRHYTWSCADDLVDLPEKYSFMKDYTHLIISQNKQDAKIFDIQLYYQNNYDYSQLSNKDLHKLDWTRKEICYDLTMKTKDKENLEVFLLSHPQITLYRRNSITY